MFYEFYNHHYINLKSPYEKTIYEAMYHAIKNRERGIIFDERRITTQRLSHIFDYVYEEHPSFFYVDPYDLPVIKNGSRSVLIFKYIYDEKTSQRFEYKIKRILMHVFDEYRINKMSDYHRIIFLHDMIASISTYDPLVSVFDSNGTPEDYNIIGVFSGKIAVCYGFSLVFKLLCDYAKIPCLVEKGQVHGSAKNEYHAWNVVAYQNKFYQIDVTWDLTKNHYQYELYKYFMVNDLWIKATRDIDLRDYPRCYDLSKTYYEYKGYCVDALEDLPVYFYKQLLNSPKEIVVVIRKTTRIPREIVDLSFRAAYDEVCKVHHLYDLSYNLNIDSLFQIIGINLIWRK